MAIGVTGVAQITKARKLFVASAIYTQEFKALAKATIDEKPLPNGQGTTWNEPYWPTLTAAALTDGVAIASPQQITDASTVITPAEVGAQIIFTRRMANVISESFASVSGKLLGNAVARKVDQDIIAQLQTFSATALGGSTTTLSGGLIGAGATRIEVGNSGTARTGALSIGDPAPKPYFAMFHPYNRYDLMSQFSGLGGAPTQVTTAAAVQNYFGQTLTKEQMDIIGTHFHENQLYGCGVYFDGNITISSNNYTAAVYAKESTVFVSFRQMDTDQEWDASRRAWQWTATQDYGVGTRVDAWGQKITLDATAPAA